MPTRRRPRLASVLGICLILVTAAAAVAGEASPVTPVPEGDALYFEPAAEAELWLLTVSGPDGYYARRELAGPGLTLSLTETPGTLPPDGFYVWELRALGPSRPSDAAVQSGAFRVESGAILLPDPTRLESPTARATSEVAVAPAPLVPDHVGPFYIDGHLAFGEDIDGTEPIGFRSMLVEENNIRLVFLDTSSTGGFATNDWQITLNEASNPGASYFGIEDLTAAATPVRIDAGASDDTIRVDQNSRVGVGTATPATTLHVVGATTLEGDLTVLSSRAAKQGLEPVDASTVLQQVTELPLLEWSYRGGGGGRHLGPVAEDFHDLFRLGGSERFLNPLDVAGVALAAIQGLRAELAQQAESNRTTLELLRDRDREIAHLVADRDELRRRIEALETLVHKLTKSETAASPAS